MVYSGRTRYWNADEEEVYMKLCVFLADGFEEIEAIGTFAILRRGGVEVDVFALSNADTTGRFGLSVTALKSLSHFDKNAYDALLLPGGPGFQLLEANEIVRDCITTYAAQGKLVCAICAAPTILGRMGYLKNRHYTCFTSMNEDFGGSYEARYVVKDENFITGRSAAATIDFGFAILEALCGKEVADKTKTEIYYEG